jgi:hypothetical protein
VAEHNLAANARLLRLGHRELHEGANRSADPIAHADHRRERGEQRVERARIASQKTTHKTR